jgi:microcystin-dependent protein
MAIIFNGQTVDWEDPILLNSDPIQEVYFNGTKVHGPSDSYTLLYSFGLAPDSPTFENTYVPTLQNTYGYAFETYYYDIGPGGDSRWRYELKRGYRMVTSDGTSGAILLWSGSLSAIPSGWALCDGTNNTPDLRNRFVLGAGDTYAVDATGGSADAVVVSHDHGVNATSVSTSSVNDPGHRHAIAKGAGYDGGTPARLTMSPFDYGTADSEIGYTNITVTTDTTTTVDVIPAGETGAGKNLPPYYALAYIMKV